MTKVLVMNIDYCSECPNEDDLGRCSLLDRGVFRDCVTSTYGMRDDCPLPELIGELEAP